MIPRWQTFAPLAAVFVAAGCARPVVRDAGQAERPRDAAPAEATARDREAGPLPDPVCAAPFPPEPKAERTMPSYRNGILDRENGEENWNAIHDALRDDPHRTGFSEAEKFFYPHIWAAEGGMRRAPGGSAIGGIMNWLVRDLKRDDNPDPFVQKLKEDASHLKTTTGVTPELLTRFYAYFFDSVLRGLPDGRKAFERVGNLHAASALADTLFRFGPTGGAELIRDAVNTTGEGRPGFTPVELAEENGHGLLGPQVFDAYSKLARDPEQVPWLLANLAAARIVKTDALAPNITRVTWTNKGKRMIANYRAGERARSIFFAYLPEMAEMSRLRQARQEKNCPPAPAMKMTMN